eukprot:CAMPEP_0177405220 /NCGR_PEP_ID=MMETSP0368-20130122/61843_1 /TAXON_ID=447022 ORGANISM="Scrippsiella hangoei-like, Strain SHHI-4" /NCGR_SAMPLE_ID=MMETSP0368 /ASSEMBLY_ACC=CAM_ASM_000363 /LENGTH=273 /DNA_ID=CAMNT_0018873405 /DNA_START=37 /DNA_END=858 /DNA_ORIENTATION=-
MAPSRPGRLRDSRRVAAGLALGAAVVSNVVAYGCGDIGVRTSVRGCRRWGNTDISCGAVGKLGYWIFGVGFTSAALSFALVFLQAAAALEAHEVRGGQVRAFRSFGFLGCALMIPMAWISMEMARAMHLLFAVVVAIKLNVPVTMVLPADASRSCLDEFENGKAGILRVKNSLTKVDSQSAEAFAPEDEAAVKDLIKKTIPGGFEEVDKKIIHFMIRWVGDQMEMHMRSLVTTGGETQSTQGSFTVFGGEVEVEVTPSAQLSLPRSLRDLSLL